MQQNEKDTTGKAVQFKFICFKFKLINIYRIIVAGRHMENDGYGTTVLRFMERTSP